MLYNTTCNILRAHRTPGAMGGFTETYTAHLSSVPCRRSAPSPSHSLYGGARQADVSAVVYIAPEHDIREGDRIEVDGNTYVTLAPTMPSKPLYQKLMLSTVRL